MVNVNPVNTRPQSDTPEIRKYKKRFNSEILCAALWGKKEGTGGKTGAHIKASVKKIVYVYKASMINQQQINSEI